MRLLQSIPVCVGVILVTMMPASTLANSSENLYEEDGQVFDDWDVCRTRCIGQDGFFQVLPEAKFRPVITFESLGENADRAYQLGQGFAKDYQDLSQRAEKIFAFARNKIRYTPDGDQFGFEEFAQNADEVATAIEQQGFAYGDCEDYAILLAVMYKGASCRSAIVLAPDHASTLVYLPGYKRANRSLCLDDESGWVWAEATGRNNALGWMPERYMGVQLVACEVTDEALTTPQPPAKSPATVIQKGGAAGVNISPFFSVIALMWLLSLFRRRR
ncbi:MAG TPA: transglutaminase domain-containing protein [Dehalococcoidia bacterium]|nr:transglutaminase domain-containing protein [Dehalococcoidia bacterium]